MTSVLGSVVPPLGAHVLHGPTTRFALHSSAAKQCAVRLYSDENTVLDTRPMVAVGDGYFTLSAEDVGHGALYKLMVDDRELPDPYARYLPFGVHGPAMVIEPRYTFRSNRPTPPEPGRQVIYELHVGTFTEHGTYASACLKLPELAELGVTTLEIMPVAAFAGARGWGYDGVALYAPFAPYGTPDELRALVDIAHGLGMTVLLDVVYNHFGPDGNYLSAYSPEYFTSEIKSPWGDAPNFAFAPMRQLVLQNVRYWLEEFRFDGLRLDAVHTIQDRSPKHVLRELVEVAHAVFPHAQLIAEDDRNDPALVSELGLNGIWADDFHHALHVTLTNERDGYYGSYTPAVAEIARAIERGWLFEGQTFSLSGKARGKRADSLDASAFVYCIQNHDQIGNRALGSRLSHDISLDAYCMASTILLFLPMTPLLFMGQEWAATSPFQFFTAHAPELGEKIVAGRRAEFSSFSAFSDAAARERIPNPQAESTFQRSILRWEERSKTPHADVLALYRKLLELRRSDPVLGIVDRSNLRVQALDDLLVIERRAAGQTRTLFANFAESPAQLTGIEGARLLLGSVSNGKLSPRGAAIYAAGDA